MLAGGTVGAWVLLRSAWVLAVMVSEAPPPAAPVPGPAFAVPGFGIPLAQVPWSAERRRSQAGTDRRDPSVLLRPSVLPLHLAHAKPALVPRLDGTVTAAMPSATDGDAAAATSDYVRNQMAMLALASSPTRGSRSAYGLTPRWAVPMPGRGAGMFARPAAPGMPAGGGRWSGSGWAFFRPDDGGPPALGRGGSLGGTQVGAIVDYRVDAAGRAHLFARVNSAGRHATATEAAAGLTFAPVRAVPVRLVLERRQSVAGNGAQSAMAAYATGGVDALPVTAGWRLDAYGAAGAVGTRHRRLFAEGSGVVHRPLLHAGPIRIDGGIGLWAAAQRGVQRVDVGPSLLAQTRAPSAAPRLSLDWRQRIDGNATPRSGLAITVARNF